MKALLSTHLTALPHPNPHGRLSPFEIWGELRFTMQEITLAAVRGDILKLMEWFYPAMNALLSDPPFATVPPGMSLAEYFDTPNDKQADWSMLRQYIHNHLFGMGGKDSPCFVFWLVGDNVGEMSWKERDGIYRVHNFDMPTFVADTDAACRAALRTWKTGFFQPQAVLRLQALEEKSQINLLEKLIDDPDGLRAQLDGLEWPPLHSPDPEAMKYWIPFTEAEYDQSWEILNSKFKFQPYAPPGKKIDPPQPTFTIDFGQGVAPEIVDLFHAHAWEWIRRLYETERPPYLYAMDWHHECYRFIPVGKPPLDEFDQWIVHGFPAGNLTFFITPDYRNGIFVSGMEEMHVIVFGREMIEAMEADKLPDVLSGFVQK